MTGLSAEVIPELVAEQNRSTRGVKGAGLGDCGGARSVSVPSVGVTRPPDGDRQRVGSSRNTRRCRGRQPTPRACGADHEQSPAGGPRRLKRAIGIRAPAQDREASAGCGFRARRAESRFGCAAVPATRRSPATGCGPALVGTPDEPLAREKAAHGRLNGRRSRSGGCRPLVQQQSWGRRARVPTGDRRPGRPVPRAGPSRSSTRAVVWKVGDRLPPRTGSVLCGVQVQRVRVLSVRLRARDSRRCRRLLGQALWLAGSVPGAAGSRCRRSPRRRTTASCRPVGRGQCDAGELLYSLSRPRIDRVPPRSGAGSGSRVVHDSTVPARRRARARGRRWNVSDALSTCAAARRSAGSIARPRRRLRAGSFPAGRRWM